MTDIAEQIGIGGRVCTKFSDDGQFVSQKSIKCMTVLVDSLIGWFYILIRDDKNKIRSLQSDTECGRVSANGILSGLGSIFCTSLPKELWA